MKIKIKKLKKTDSISRQKREMLRRTHFVKKKSRVKYYLLGLFLIAFFLFISPPPDNDYKKETVNDAIIDNSALSDIVQKPEEPPKNKNSDIEAQKPLANPPEEIKALYSTGWSAGNAKKMDGFIDLIKKHKLNALVIDIKDYSGLIFYDIEMEEISANKAKEIRIPKINSLLKKLHDGNIYAIARIAVFQDSLMASARPELAVKNKITGKVWKDNKGLAWIDPAAREYWDYIVKISQNAAARGFDEINFDYIRFPSDGSLSGMDFPFYDSETRTKSEALKEFFVYLRSSLKGIKISADLFGLATINKDDLGIGQVIEDAYANFDFVSPMVYPSHYANGFLGYKNPAEYPYEVVKYSLEKAVKRLNEYNDKTAKETENKAANKVKIRPWLQVFDLGAKYGPKSVGLQIKASDEAGSVGWMLWSPSNNYAGKIAEAE